MLLIGIRPHIKIYEHTDTYIFDLCLFYTMVVILYHAGRKYPFYRLTLVYGKKKRKSFLPNELYSLFEVCRTCIGNNLMGKTKQKVIVSIQYYVAFRRNVLLKLFAKTLKLLYCFLPPPRWL